ncbi:MAG: hypothetical protein ACRDEB_04000 [Chitinophagaceae bacterium]
MSEGFMVDEKNQLREVSISQMPPQPVAVRVIAKIISYIFHPVFVPVYLVLFMVYVHPWSFAGFSELDKTRTVIMAALMFTFFPVITVLLLKALKFIKSFQLTTQKDRIIPLVACGIWYFWIWYVWRNLPEYPPSAIQLALAIWISATLGLMANIIMKISLHSISMGVMLAFIFLLAFTQQLNFGIYISLALLIAGLVCSSRLIVSNHEPKEIYGGLVIGIFSMLVAGWAG